MFCDAEGAPLSREQASETLSRELALDREMRMYHRHSDTHTCGNPTRRCACLLQMKHSGSWSCRIQHAATCSGSGMLAVPSRLLEAAYLKLLEHAPGRSKGRLGSRCGRPGRLQGLEDSCKQ